MITLSYVDCYFGTKQRHRYIYIENAQTVYLWTIFVRVWKCVYCRKGNVWSKALEALKSPKTGEYVCKQELLRWKWTSLLNAYCNDRQNSCKENLLLRSQLFLWVSPFLVRFLCMWPFLNPTIEVVTILSSCMVHAGCVFVSGNHPFRTWMSGSFESMQWNACVHRLDLGLYSHPKEFLGYFGISEWLLGNI